MVHREPKVKGNEILELGVKLEGLCLQSHGEMPGCGVHVLASRFWLGTRKGLVLLVKVSSLLLCSPDSSPSANRADDRSLKGISCIQDILELSLALGKPFLLPSNFGVGGDTL